MSDGGHRTELRIPLVAAIFFAACSVALASPTTITRLPDLYKLQAQQLTASCGADRAQTIANLTWDIDIHKDWLTKVKADPSLWQADGNPSWHGYWISVYQHTIALLQRDCQ